ncbi:Phosphopantothenate--cysteine ligase CAB2 [Erysiphe necator]|nr:Phosphopantothenate--cysteine ligase CAB2 [Erysiphe necator]
MKQPMVPENAEQDYFNSNPPPVALDEHKALAQNFINAHAASGNRLVLITSGGTIVPLEKRTVRFIDNFSAGTRGATSAEYFLEAGYAVIFLHRQFSLLPYSRHYSHATHCFLDFLHEGPDGRIIANEEYREEMLMVLRKYNEAKEKKMLLTIPFVTVTDYLFTLRSVSQLMRPLAASGLLYLAAAVSDFFIPSERMPEHKIQSTGAVEMLSAIDANSSKTVEKEDFDNFDSSPKVPRSKRLIVDLDPLPKFLKKLVEEWAPEGMIVSFKLETDPDILIQKAQYSLERYQHHLVIGNLLATRKSEVVFVAPGQEHRWIRTDSTSANIEALNGEEKNQKLQSKNKSEIEKLIIPAIVELHDIHVERNKFLQSKP